MGSPEYAELAMFMREILGRVERLDERTKMIQSSTESLKEEFRDTANNLKEEIKELNQKVSAEYVKKNEFDPIKRFVYGVIAFILASVGAMFFTLIKP